MENLHLKSVVVNNCELNAAEALIQVVMASAEQSSTITGENKGLKTAGFNLLDSAASVVAQDTIGAAQTNASRGRVSHANGGIILKRGEVQHSACALFMNLYQSERLVRK